MQYALSYTYLCIQYILVYVQYCTQVCTQLLNCMFIVHIQFVQYVQYVLVVCTYEYCTSAKFVDYEYIDVRVFSYSPYRRSLACSVTYLVYCKQDIKVILQLYSTVYCTVQHLHVQYMYMVIKVILQLYSKVQYTVLYNMYTTCTVHEKLLYIYTSTYIYCTNTTVRYIRYFLLY